MRRDWIDTTYAAQVPNPPHPVTLIHHWLGAFKPGELAPGCWLEQHDPPGIHPSRITYTHDLIAWLTLQITHLQCEAECARAFFDESDDFKIGPGNISPHCVRWQYMVALRVRLRRLLEPAPVTPAASAPMPQATVVPFPMKSTAPIRPIALPEAA